VQSFETVLEVGIRSREKSANTRWHVLKNESFSELSLCALPVASGGWQTLANSMGISDR